jgi:S-adenosylmethionine uptake transporter
VARAEPPTLPGSDAQRIVGLLSAAVSAVSYSGVVVLARHQAQRDALWTILLVQNLLPTAGAGRAHGLALAAAGGRRHRPGAADGPAGHGGLLGITWAFSHIEASRAAPVEYTGFVWAALLGFCCSARCRRPGRWRRPR